MGQDVESSTVRIYSANRKIEGVGFLVDGTHLLTCAHVVREALGLRKDQSVQPGSVVRVDFPQLAARRKLPATVEVCCPATRHGILDMAGLELCEPPPQGAARARLLALDIFRDRKVDVFGFPRGYPRGGWIRDATLARPTDPDHVQLESGPNAKNPIRPGFSGGAVLDVDTGAVIGMITDADEERGTAEMIPVSVLAGVWNGVPAPQTMPAPSAGRQAGTLDKPGNVPRLPSWFVPRPEHLDPLKKLLLAESSAPVAVTAAGTVGLHGMGGIGKTVLAAAVAHDDDVRRRFPDGVIWLTIGRMNVSVERQERTLTARQAQVAEAIGGGPRSFEDVQQGKARLGDLLAGKACLIILDDVWDARHARALDALGPQCRMLITTRDAALVRSLDAAGHCLDVLTDDQARRLLADWAQIEPAALPAEADRIIARCDRLPLALAMVGAMVKGRPDRWGSALRKLQQADLEKLRREFDYPYPNLFAALDAGVQDLDTAARVRYFDLAVFPEDTPIPEATLHTCWTAQGCSDDDVEETQGCSDDDVDETIDLLIDRSLARRDEAGRIVLHDLQHDYVRKRADPLQDRRRPGRSWRKRTRASRPPWRAFAARRW